MNTPFARGALLGLHGRLVHWAGLDRCIYGALKSGPIKIWIIYFDFLFWVFAMDHRETIIREAVAVSKFKIEWAKQHINGVEQIIKKVIAENSDVVRIDNDSHPAKVSIGPSQFIPPTLPLHLGDAIHNLNSTTDYMWTALAKAAGSDRVSRASFPRHETRQNLARCVQNPTGADTAIYTAFPQAKAFILDRVNPCSRGDGDPSYIWRLNKLDGINKHRLLIITTHLIRFENKFSFIGADGGRIAFSAAASIQTQGHPMTLGLTPPIKTDNDPKAIVDAVFAEPDHFTGQPVIKTLVDLTNAVSELLNLFEKTFL